MNRIRNAFRGLALSLLLVAAGCSEGDNVIIGGADGGMIDPPLESSISGDWSTSTTEVLDTCGFDPIPPQAPLRVEESGDAVIFTFGDGQGNCAESVRTRSGDKVVLNRTDTFDAGCGLVRVQSSVVYEFTESTLSGIATHQYSMIDGQCGGLPCTYQLAVGGTRCDGCFPTCTTVSSDDSGIDAEGAAAFPASSFGPAL